MGGKKANVAVGRSLLKVVWCVLKSGNPYREPDAGVMHEMERQKLVHHHARRLRALGAEPDTIEAIVQQLLCPVTTEETQSDVAVAEVGVAGEDQVTAPCKPLRTACRLAKERGELCRGKLGFRARQKRRQPRMKRSADVPQTTTANHLNSEKDP